MFSQPPRPRAVLISRKGEGPPIAIPENCLRTRIPGLTVVSTESLSVYLSWLLDAIPVHAPENISKGPRANTVGCIPIACRGWHNLYVSDDEANAPSMVTKLVTLMARVRFI